jgi:nucleoside-diphosphate-sugar epimerase
VAGNVYGYGAGAVGPLTPDLEPDPTTRKGTTRHIMWQRALCSNVPAIEVRASDYLGKGAVTYFSLLALPSLLRNEPVAFLGDLNAAHAWSFTGDTAKTLVAASRFTGEWGRAFHVPSQSASVRELVQRFAAALKIDGPKLLRLTSADLDSIGFGEAVEMSYLFEKPLLLDAGDTEKLLGITASSLDAMVHDTLAVQ